MTNAVSLRTNVEGNYKGQLDATIIAAIGDEQVGYLSYSVYQDVPSIKMIWVEPQHRREKIAIQMLKSLQSQYPNSEIEWGYTTEPGAALKQSIKFRKEPNLDVMKKIEKLTSARAKLQKLDYKLTRLRDTDPETARKYVKTVGDRWNKLHDLEYKLENQLSVMGKPYSHYIDDKMNEELNIMRRLAGIGERKLSNIGSNISLTGNEKGKLMRKHNIRPGDPNWFKLWFSLPFMTGEKPV